MQMLAWATVSLRHPKLGSSKNEFENHEARWPVLWLSFGCYYSNQHSVGKTRTELNRSVSQDIQSTVWPSRLCF